MQQGGQRMYRTHTIMIMQQFQKRLSQNRKN